MKGSWSRSWTAHSTLSLLWNSSKRYSRARMGRLRNFSSSLKHSCPDPSSIISQAFWTFQQRIFNQLSSISLVRRLCSRGTGALIPVSFRFITTFRLLFLGKLSFVLAASTASQLSEAFSPRKSYRFRKTQVYRKALCLLKFLWTHCVEARYRAALGKRHLNLPFDQLFSVFRRVSHTLSSSWCLSQEAYAHGALYL